MVSIYYGRAGTGKTCLLENEARRLIKEGVRVFFVVPEQLSMSREYAFNESGLENIEVLSFSRLANSIFRTLGGTAKKLPDSAMSAAALYRAVTEVYDGLEYYKSVAHTSGFISKLKTAFAEFDTCRITLESIEAIPNENISFSVLSKYRDLFLIYNRYKSLWNGEYRAPGDDLCIASGKLETSDIFSDAVFMFDGFYGFTKQQLIFIKQIILQAAGCFFAFTTDLESELFATVTSEVGRIAAICKKNDVPVSFLKAGDTPHRLETESQRFMEKYALGTPDIAPPFPENSGGLSVYAAKNPGEELNYIACKIKNDVLNGKYRYRDIAVLSPDSGESGALITAVFAKHGVPVFADMKKTLLSAPLTAMVLSAVETAFEGFTFENVFSYLKTGLAGISFDDISLLENYVRMWKIKGKGWLAERWTQSPSGLSGNDSDLSRLERINELKDKTVLPLLQFAKRLKAAKNCRSMLYAVCELFDALDVNGKLNARAEYFESTGDIYLKEEYTRIYEIFIGMLDSIDEIFCNTEISIQRFYDILCVSAQSITVSPRPSCADEVIFSGVGRVRAENIKCVYVCRLNDGFLPKAPCDADLITDTDKRLFSKYGISTSMDFIQSSMRERFDFYSAMMSASRQLCLSYSMFETTGENLLKSEYLENIERLTGRDELTFEKLPPEFFLVSISAVSDLAAATEDKALTDAVYKAGGITPITEINSDRLEDDIVRGLYSRNLRLSFSGMEEFIGCPFKFFIHRGLKASKNEPVEMNPANIGTFIHHGLERLLSDGYDLNGNIEEYVNKISEEYYNGALADCKGKSKRFDWLFSRAKNALNSAALNVVKEIQSSDFVPFDFEIDISEYTPPSNLPNGCTLTLVGSIDRVDMLEKKGARFAKIIDYKSGSQEFSLKKIYNGLSMQLPIYAGAVQSKFPDVKIAAMYYLKVGAPVTEISDKSGISDKEFKDKTDLFYKRDGVFSSDAKDAGRLGEGIKSLEKIKKDRLFTQNGIDGLISYARQKIKDTGNAVMTGDVSVSPIDDRSFSACEYCDYKDICKITRRPECARELEAPPDGFLKEDM